MTARSQAGAEMRTGRARQEPGSRRTTHLLTVDWARCTGQGVCAAALGERIDLDTWGYPTGVTTRGQPIPAGLVGAARLAVASCPAAALRLTRDTGA